MASFDEELQTELVLGIFLRQRRCIAIKVTMMFVGAAYFTEKAAARRI